MHTREQQLLGQPEGAIWLALYSNKRLVLELIILLALIAIGIGQGDFSETLRNGTTL